MIDLHMHSTFSDGTLTPEALAKLAGGFGLTAIALTDHDGMAGTPRFLAACEKEGVRGISGVEISAQVSKGTMHILGYFVDHTDEELENALARIRNGREARNKEILEKLNALGCPLDWEDVQAMVTHLRALDWQYLRWRAKLCGPRQHMQQVLKDLEAL